MKDDEQINQYADPNDTLITPNHLILIGPEFAEHRKMSNEPNNIHPGTSSSESNKIHCTKDTLNKQYGHRYVNDLRNGLRQAKDDNIFFDVTIIVEDRRFQCHKLILGIFSGFFKLMFTSGMKECHESEIELKSVNSEIFEIILTYIYTGVFEKSVNLRELLTTSLYLQIKSLSDICQQMMCDDLNVTRAIDLWRIANQHGNECEIMLRACQKWMLENFKSFFNNEEFLTLSADEVIFLLFHDDLSVTREDDVCTFVIKWIQQDPTNRKQYVNNIMKHVRLPLVKGPILRHVRKYVKLHDCGHFSKSLLEAEHYQRRTAQQCHVNTLQTEPRKCSSMEKGLIIISGSKDRDSVDRCREVWFYSFQANKWHRLPKLPHMEHGFATCTFGRSTVCVTGGAENSNCYKYNGTGRHNKWKSFDSMMEERAGHGLIAVNKCIYAIGGMQLDYTIFLGRKSLASIEKFDTFTKRWDYCGDLVFEVVDMAVSVVENTIYIFPHPFYTNNDIQSFDVSTNTASVLEHCESLTNIRCVGIDDEVYLITTENKNINIKLFNTDDEKPVSVEQVAIDDKIEEFESVKWGSKLYILGGVCNSLLQSKIYEYNFQTKSIREFEEQLPYPLCEFGCHVVTVKKEFFN